MQKKEVTSYWARQTLMEQVVKELGQGMTANEKKEFAEVQKFMLDHDAGVEPRVRREMNVGL